MANVIDQLRSEHGDVVKILKILEAELDKFEGPGVPDYDLISNIAEYFLDYPDACHHPKEDAVYRALIASRPVSTGPVFDMEAEHRVIHELVLNFADAAEDIDGEGDMSPRFLKIARRFIDVQLQHIATEEAKLFPMALDALSDDDWAAIDARIVSKTDPVFGNIPEAQFELLRERITSWDGVKSDTRQSDFASASV